MNYSSRFFLYAPLGVFLALALGVSIHWWLAASAFSDRLAKWNGHEIAPGVTMQFASRTISGFPFSMDTVMQDVSFRIATPHGPTEWRSEHFAMHALTYGRDETIFEAAGKQELRWTRDGGTVRDLVFAVGSLHASAIQDAHGLARFDLDIVGFGSRAFTAQRLQFHTRKESNKLDLVVVIDNLVPPRGSCDGLGVTNAALKGTLSQAKMIAPLLEGKQRWEDVISAWRTANGRLSPSEIPFAPASRLQSALPALRAEDVVGVSGLIKTVCNGPH